MFSEGQAAVVADRIIARLRGSEPASQYGGRGTCYLQFGKDQVALVEVTFVQGQRPTGGLEGPSAALAASKVEFGAGRARRWFNGT